MRKRRTVTLTASATALTAGFVAMMAAFCERSLQIAGFEPDQLRAAYHLSPVRGGHHR
jgi:hypothetical protein